MPNTVDLDALTKRFSEALHEVQKEPVSTSAWSVTHGDAHRLIGQKATLPDDAHFESYDYADKNQVLAKFAPSHPVVRFLAASPLLVDEIDSVVPEGVDGVLKTSMHPGADGHVVIPKYKIAMARHVAGVHRDSSKLAFERAKKKDEKVRKKRAIAANIQDALAIANPAEMSKLLAGASLVLGDDTTPESNLVSDLVRELGAHGESLKNELDVNSKLTDAESRYSADSYNIESVLDEEYERRRHTADDAKKQARQARQQARQLAAAPEYDRDVRDIAASHSRRRAVAANDAYHKSRSAAYNDVYGTRVVANHDNCSCGMSHGSSAARRPRRVAGNSHDCNGDLSCPGCMTDVMSYQF